MAGEFRWSAAVRRSPKTPIKVAAPSGLGPLAGAAACESKTCTTASLSDAVPHRRTSVTLASSSVQLLPAKLDFACAGR